MARADVTASFILTSTMAILASEQVSFGHSFRVVQAPSTQHPTFVPARLARKH